MYIIYKTNYITRIMYVGKKRNVLKKPKKKKIVIIIYDEFFS